MNKFEFEIASETLKETRVRFLECFICAISFCFLLNVIDTKRKSWDINEIWLYLDAGCSVLQDSEELIILYKRASWTL